MMKEKLITLFVLMSVLLIIPTCLDAEDFSKEQAFEHLKMIAETIGPRPLGSPNEKAALTYFAEKMAEYGAEVEWQPVTEFMKAKKGGSKAEEYMDGLNTNSFNVIGRFAGENKREIVIGAHIDSLSPEIPGADDDGSGVATLLELARVISQERHYSTMTFVAFCGEESGLIGSRTFAEKYPLKNVKLMLQLDMTSNDSPLMLWIDTEKKQSPGWLVNASINTFHSLGYKNIDYPTHFQSLNSSLGGAGSDHTPFLDRNIPAIAFVSDVRFPIHSRSDSLENFKIDGLERSGKLVLELIRQFDREQPEKNFSHYMLLLIGERPLYIPYFLLIIVIILSIILGIYTLMHLRRQRKDIVDLEQDKKIRFSWPKLTVLHLVIIVTSLASVWLMQLLKGQRFPWYLHPGSQMLYAFLFLILGIWLALQILRKWRLRKNPFFYFIRAFIYLTVLILLAWALVNPRFALYPALGLLFLSLACLAPYSWLKGILWLLSPYFMFRMLVFPEYYEAVYTTMAGMGFVDVNTFGKSLFATAIFILFMLLWSMPYLLGFAAVYRSQAGDLFALKHFRCSVALVPIGILIIAGAVYLYPLSVYTSIWEQRIFITQKLDSKEKKPFIEFKSSDYLKEITATINGKKEFINTRSCLKKIDSSFKLDWLKEKISKEVKEEGKEKLVRLTLQLEFDKQPYSFRLELKSNKAYKIEKANAKYRHKKKKAVMRWFSFPEKTHKVELNLRMPKEATLDAEISAIFLETPLQITCEGTNKHFIHRAEIKREIELLK